MILPALFAKLTVTTKTSVTHIQVSWRVVIEVIAILVFIFMLIRARSKMK